MAFDQVICEYPLPSPFEQYQNRVFQTKSFLQDPLSHMWLFNYIISKNGILLRENYPIDTDPDTVVVEKEQFIFTGDCIFYDFVDATLLNVVGAKPGWIEFSASFNEGRLIAITLKNYEPSSDNRGETTQ